MPSLLPGRTAKQGFTLLELLIVCLLISISLGLSLPSLRQSLITDQLAAGSRKVISLIQSGRSMAVRENEPYIIRQDPVNRTVWYEQAEIDEDGEETTEATPPLRSSITLPEGIRIQRIQQANAGDKHNPEKEGLWISRQGYMDKTTIQLVDGDNNSINLLISPFLQRIKILDQPVDFP